MTLFLRMCDSFSSGFMSVPLIWSERLSVFCILSITNEVIHPAANAAREATTIRTNGVTWSICTSSSIIFLVSSLSSTKEFLMRLRSIISVPDVSNAHIIPEKNAAAAMNCRHSMTAMRLSCLSVIPTH